ncbi:MAG: hypothetical protein AAFN81_15670 [Bacteroidota bacterium]
MKHALHGLLLAIGLWLLSSTQVFGQEPRTAVTALKLQEEFVQLFQQKKDGIFTVDAKGILRPEKTHEIYYLKEKQYFVIKPQGSKWVEDVTSMQSQRLPGGAGTATCLCFPYVTNDDCHFAYDEEESDDIGDIFNCEGSCVCELQLLLGAVKTVSGYETPGGDWFNF